MITDSQTNKFSCKKERGSSEQKDRKIQIDKWLSNGKERKKDRKQRKKERKKRNNLSLR